MSVPVRFRTYLLAFLFVLPTIAAPWVDARAQSSAGTAPAPSATPAAATKPAASIPIEDFVRHDKLERVVLSPTGTYLATVVRLDANDVLMILRTDDLTRVSINPLAEGDRLVQLFWSSPDRLLFSAARSKGRFIAPDELEAWAAIDADGTDFERIRVARGQSQDIATTTVKTGYFDVLDAPGRDDGKVLVNQFIIRNDRPLEEIGEIDTYSGALRAISRTPRLQCDVAMKLDQPVLAVCPKKERERRRRKGSTDDDDDGGEEVYRYVGPSEWALVKTYAGDDGRIALTGWSDDGHVYATHSDRTTPVSFGTLDPQTGAFTRLFQDKVADPSWRITTRDNRGVTIGVVTEAALPKVTMIDGDHADAAIYGGLSELFPRQAIVPLNSTRDGKRFLFRVESDLHAGELYLYDREQQQVRPLLRHREWLPREMARTRAFVSTTRDGVKVYGYLTIPPGSDGKRLPMIVSVHGGPIGVRDHWAFDEESQLLASRGYLVLRVNFRGSEGYGRAFAKRAYGQWGSGIMHDIIDATQWAIDQGHADKDRICIYGGSFGGYAAMMAPTVAPGMFRCAFGYVGLYDAEIQMKKSDTARTRDGRDYLVRALGATPEERRAISPVARADRIRIPVYLVAGADDERCPPEHTIAMQKALIAAGNPPEGVIIQKGEKHGFEKLENNLRLYTEMLAFFERHIGAASTPPPPAAP
jgi:dienelactone hydrolase